ncbi:MAG: hypothetical protein L6R40_000015 [Gallowayella cf. fulva]|nr:MAG: hypothetical protein L6R40_000015 [Xanthomendoza cf. fulva]
MRSSYLGLAIALFSTLSLCDNPSPEAKLTKPTLYPAGTDIFEPTTGLKDGLMANLHPMSGSKDRWGPGWIPKACAAPNSHKDPIRLEDTEVWNFHYDDCPQPWTVCYNKKSGYHIETVFDLFGRIPVKSRAYVRTLMILPRETGQATGYAYTSNQDIVIYGNDIDNLMIYLHEVGHALDLGGAYSDHGSWLSTSDDWLKNYNLDAKVVDGYAQTNQFENVAQNHIVDSYDVNVPGGFGMLNGGWQQIYHQYATLDRKQKKAGNRLVPGPGDVCGKRVPNDETIPFPSKWTSRMMRRRAVVGEKPNVDLASGLERIPPVEFDTRQFCARYQAAHKH